MVIMIIFLVLSVVIVISTVFYLNYKKNNNNIKKEFSIEKQEKGKRKSKKQLADILQVKIKDNIICLRNRYSIIVRLGNIDYNILSESEQNSVENALIKTALAIDYPIQFFSTTEYIDTSKIVSLIKQNKVKNEKIQEYKEFLIEYLQGIMNNRLISIVKNYVIISYDGLYENAIEELNQKANLFKGNLIKAKIVCEILNEEEVYNLIHRELNKNSTSNINNLKEGGENLYVGKKQKTKSKEY